MFSIEQNFDAVFAALGFGVFFERMWNEPSVLLIKIKSSFPRSQDGFKHDIKISFPLCCFRKRGAGFSSTFARGIWWRWSDLPPRTLGRAVLPSILRSASLESPCLFPINMNPEAKACSTFHNWVKNKFKIKFWTETGRDASRLGRRFLAGQRQN